MNPIGHWGSSVQVWVQKPDAESSATHRSLAQTESETPEGSQASPRASGVLFVPPHPSMVPTITNAAQDARMEAAYFLPVLPALCAARVATFTDGLTITMPLLWPATPPFTSSRPLSAITSITCRFWVVLFSTP